MKKSILHLLACLLLCLGSMSTLLAQHVTSTWSTDVALPGERVLLYLIKENSADEQFELLARPTVENASLRVLPYRTLTKQNEPWGQPVILLPLLITPDSSGEVRVKDVRIRFLKSGKEEQLTIPPLKVYSTSEITWFNNPIPYGMLWALDKKEPYVNESIAARLKILLPAGVDLASLPSFNTSGLKIFPFQLATQGMLYNIQQGILGMSVVQARGNQWINYDLSSTIVPYQEGKNEASGKISIAQQVNLLSVRREEILLPTLNISALPLPLGAPAHFDKLVGEYQVTASTEAKKLAMNEAIDMTIRVTGTGALDNISCPRLVDEEGWKIVPATKKVESDINGVTTAVVFHQIIRPTREESAIPAMRLSYFNPKTQLYETAESKPIALPWEQTDSAGLAQLDSSAQAAPPAGEVPIAEMRDIYDMLPEEIDAQSLHISPRYYALLYIPAVLIVLYLLMARLRQARAQGSAGRRLEKELRALSGIADPMSFLRQSAAFIEKHLGEVQSEALAEIIRRRDDEAFRPDGQSQLSKAERKTMLQHLRHAVSQASKKLPLLILTLLLALSFGTQVCAQAPSEYDQQGMEQYEKGQYTAARELFEKGVHAITHDHANQGRTSLARLYYHLGNSYYRLNEPGQAALSYARALEQNDDLIEAEVNLAFVQRKQGAILAPAGLKQDIFTYFAADSLLLLTVSVTAVLLTSVLLLIALPAGRRIVLRSVIAISALVTLLCGANWLYYLTLETPHISMLEPSDIAYVTQPTEARSAADEKGSSVVRLPASTPLRILARRPSWDYIECMNGVRGWVPKTSIDTLAPSDRP